MLDAIVRGFKKLWDVSDDVSPRRYRSLGRLLSFLMIIVSVAPLLVLSWINYNQYQASISRETEVPLRDVVQRTSSALEVLLGERLSTVSLISQAYTYGQLSNEENLTRIFLALRSEFTGFVDLGLINEDGIQTRYVGPYQLQNVDYSTQPWWKDVQVHGKVVSDIISGARGVPHLVLAVGHLGAGGLPGAVGRVGVGNIRLLGFAVNVQHGRIYRRVGGIIKINHGFQLASFHGGGVLPTACKKYIPKHYSTNTYCVNRLKSGPGRLDKIKKLWYYAKT